MYANDNGGENELDGMAIQLTPPIVPDVRLQDEQRQRERESGRLAFGSEKDKVNDVQAQVAVTVCEFGGGLMILGQRMFGCVMKREVIGSL